MQPVTVCGDISATPIKVLQEVKGMEPSKSIFLGSMLVKDFNKSGKPIKCICSLTIHYDCIVFAH